MGFSRKTWALRVGLVLGIVALFATSMHLDGMTARWPWAVLVGAVFAQLGGEWWLRRQAWRTVSTTIATYGLDEAAALLGELRGLSAGRPRSLLVIELYLAVIESMRGRYTEARTRYERLLESEHLGGYRAIVENNLAWALMHLGITGRALTLAKNALAEGEARKASYVGLFRGTYAVGLVLSGRCEEAVPLLERVLVNHAGDGAHAQAARAFYLGEALAELGRGDEARAAYLRAEREAPGSIWAEQARVKLSPARAQA